MNIAATAQDRRANRTHNTILLLVGVVVITDANPVVMQFVAVAAICALWYGLAGRG